MLLHQQIYCPTDKGGRYIFFASLSSDATSADTSNQFIKMVNKKKEVQK